ncbi:sigma-70 family RNA polymerase sigma factor [Thermoanaerobacter sp. CM-CNRG TB177]|uniref:sigma-70 family RNA polymerase sigma factor n=1 Tax=Thermoanaerobacter sp. CM-CNRG TB177 TaxID=2800659 RepID=UPI001BDF6CD4|nr:sigma-70 family RNA polymerase sigma factor [Thermoanaerobacter sp. CM-CNRG TB177]
MSVPVMEKSKEIELFERLKRGEKKAKDEIVERNRGLVISIAVNFSKTYGVELDDLIQEGFIGLLTAIEKFDYTKGYKFSTYAVPYIRQKIQRYIWERSKIIHFPIKTYQKLNQILSAQLRLEQIRGEVPLEEIVKETGIKIEEVVSLLNLKNSGVSLNQQLNEDYNTELLDIISDEQIENEIDRSYSLKELRKILKECLKALPDRERSVLEMRYGLNGEPMTLKEAAKKLNISKQRVGQIEKRALQRLRDNKKVKNALLDFLHK